MPKPERSYTIKGFTPEEYERIRVAAAMSALSMNKWMLEAIREKLAREGGEK